MHYRSVLVLTLLYGFHCILANAAYLRPCYFTNWAQYRPGRAKFMPEYYLPGLCTHILFAFGWMNEDFTAKAFDPVDLPTEWAGAGLYVRVNALKQSDHQLRTLLSFGGWSFGTALFQRMAESAASRQVFIDSAIAFVRTHGFDGIDIDWEYPTATDRDAFSAFFAELLEAAQHDATVTGRPRLLITAAVAAGTENIANGYDIPTISQYLDFVLLMSYDFHGSWEQVTGMNAPLFDDGRMPTNSEWNVAGAANRWTADGMPRSKIVVGVPTYGRGWTLTEPAARRDVGAPGRSARATPFVRLEGTGAYYEFCEMLSKGALRYFDNATKVPYLIDNDQWFSYDDVESVRYKAAWIKQNGYGGAFVWTLDFDDFNGQCPDSNGSPYPLIRTIAAELDADVVVPYVKPSAAVITTNKYSTQRPYIPPLISANFNGKPVSISGNADEALNRACYGQVDGFRAPPISGTAAIAGDFLLCLNGRGYLLHCPAGLEFNAFLGYCTWPTKSVVQPSQPVQPVQPAKPLLPVQSSLQAVSPATARPLWPTAAPGRGDATAPFTCSSDGFFADPQFCERFYRCAAGVAFRFDCPAGLQFDARAARCDHAALVTCPAVR